MDRILLMTTDKESYTWILNHAEPLLERKELVVTKREPHSQPDVADTIAALNDEDMRRKNASWIREVPNPKVVEVLKTAKRNKDKIRTYSLIVDGPWKRISEAVDEIEDSDITAVILSPDVADPRSTPDMEYEPDSPKNPNAPFTYDPNYDYYTNP